VSIVCGIDLSGSERKASGICFMDENLNVNVFLRKKDEEILSLIFEEKPKVIAIDSPLTLPKGRNILEEISAKHLRECDRALLYMGIKLFPATLGPMRMLTRRGINLKHKLEREGFKVIEVLPGATQDLLGLPRKSHGKDKLFFALKELGIKGIHEKMNADELDAITCAYTALLYIKGEYEEVGSIDEGTIIIPKIYL